MIEKATQLINWWKETGTIHEGDSRVQVVGRQTLRVVGIFLLFVISPVLVTAMVFLAFFAVF